MKASCYDSQTSLEISFFHVQLLVEAILKLKEVETDEVIFHFVDKKTISDLHKQFFHDPTPTDCISFPIDQTSECSVGHHILGEVFICPQVALEYAEKHQLDPYTELSLYITHGILHLIGYDDLSPHEEKIMREEEKRCMKYLKEQNALINDSTQN